MSTWGEQLRELARLKAEGEPKPGDPSPHDRLRRKYLAELANHTGRAAIVYATCYLENREVPNGLALTVNPGDKQGFMEAVSNIKGVRELDLIITSPGGSPEAAEAIMDYLRTRFDHIRAIVPVAAMSAATMMALACDEIVMGTHSQLGPIDPQFTIQTPEGPRYSPAQAILDQFELAKLECQDPKVLAAWMPLLRALTPGLLAQCVHSRQLAEQFVATQLKAHMLSNDQAKADAVAAWFADFSFHKSHGRPVSLDDARDQGLAVSALEDDQVLQDLVLSVHHAVRHTFNDTGTTKLIENHLGRAYIEMMSVQAFRVNQGQLPMNPTGAGGSQPAMNRAQRRQADRKK